MTVARAPRERKRPEAGADGVGREVLDVELPGPADPVGFVKEKAGLSDFRVPLFGAQRMRWGVEAGEAGL